MKLNRGVVLAVLALALVPFCASLPLCSDVKVGVHEVCNAYPTQQYHPLDECGRLSSPHLDSFIDLY
jgi:hypothetical protein